MTEGYDNAAYIPDTSNEIVTISGKTGNESTRSETEEKDEGTRDNWGRGIEFLLSCIAMSVGLGNVWRFPFVALDNGGGAFLIPYIIILVLVGKPGYYLEMIIGQFSSRGAVKVFDCVPAMRGVGIGQVFSVICISTYYSSLMALTLRYFFYSFFPELPWSVCNPDWTEPCYASGGKNENLTRMDGMKSSAELYFQKEVLRAPDNINNGIGWPNLDLFGFLVLAWTVVVLILIKGIKSAGKAAYITGIAPFIFLIIFLVRALTLPGSFDGIVYFFTPNWQDVLKPSVWYAAVTQLFFSLNVFLANIIMYSSYNKFDHNIYRDANIVTTIDTFTSILAGSITFGIVGHLKRELQAEDIKTVFQGGPGLVFVTYPETISKFTFIPQLFAVLFFLMLFILGMGSILAMTSCVITVIRDQFPRVKYWQAALGYGLFGIATGSFYVTPGGQAVLELVDHYGANFVTFILAAFELVTFCHIYGVKRLSRDVEFMLGFQPGIYWKACWYFITPVIMISIVIYTLTFYNPPTYAGQDFPTIAYVAGWFIASFGLMWLPLVCLREIMKQKEEGLLERIAGAFKPRSTWGPMKTENFVRYQEFIKHD